jgi:hypothetical protein
VIRLNNWEESIPDVGAVVISLLGFVFGFFVGRFLFGLFSREFSPSYALVGVGSIFVLSMAYSLPVYHREISSLIQDAGITSVKTGVLELTFAEHQAKGLVQSASTSTAVSAATGVPRPSDPRGALQWLKQQLDPENGYRSKDRKYIQMFEPNSAKLVTVGQWVKDDLTKDDLTRAIKSLSDCLNDYALVSRDSQLLLVDIKPVIQKLLILHASTRRVLDPCADAKDASSEATQACPKSTVDEGRYASGANQIKASGVVSAINDVMDTINKVMNSQPDQIRPLVTQCSTAISSDEQKPYDYLQPYTPIALATLLWAHGAPDEGVDVLAEWLDMWSCARAEPGRRKDGCPRESLPEAKHLPEWFRHRVEFELAALLWRVTGYANINFRDFVDDHRKRFEEYVRASPGGISLKNALAECNARIGAGRSYPESGDPVQVGALRLLHSLETDVLRSEFFVVPDKELPELEDLYDRAVVLLSFDLRCFDLLRDRNMDGTLAEAKVNAALVGLAAADRVDRIGSSADVRQKAREMRDYSRNALRESYRVLKRLRDKDRDDLQNEPWGTRLFGVSGWEGTYTLATQAIERLNASEQ